MRGTTPQYKSMMTTSYRLSKFEGGYVGGRTPKIYGMILDKNRNDYCHLWNIIFFSRRNTPSRLLKTNQQPVKTGWKNDEQQRREKMHTKGRRK